MLGWSTEVAGAKGDRCEACDTLGHSVFIRRARYGGRVKRLPKHDSIGHLARIYRSDRECRVAPHLRCHEGIAFEHDFEDLWRVAGRHDLEVYMRRHTAGRIGTRLDGVEGPPALRVRAEGQLQPRITIVAHGLHAVVAFVIRLVDVERRTGDRGIVASDHDAADIERLTWFALRRNTPG